MKLSSKHPSRLPQPKIRNLIAIHEKPKERYSQVGDLSKPSNTITKESGLLVTVDHRTPDEAATTTSAACPVSDGELELRPDVSGARAINVPKLNSRVHALVQKFNGGTNATSSTSQSTIPCHVSEQVPKNNNIDTRTPIDVDTLYEDGISPESREPFSTKEEITKSILPLRDQSTGKLESKSSFENFENTNGSAESKEEIFLGPTPCTLDAQGASCLAVSDDFEIVGQQDVGGTLIRDGLGGKAFDPLRDQPTTQASTLVKILDCETEATEKGESVSLSSVLESSKEVSEPLDGSTHSFEVLHVSKMGELQGGHPSPENSGDATSFQHHNQSPTDLLSGINAETMEETVLASTLSDTLQVFDGHSRPSAYGQETAEMANVDGHPSLELPAAAADTELHDHSCAEPRACLKKIRPAPTEEKVIPSKKADMLKQLSSCLHSSIEKPDIVEWAKIDSSQSLEILENIAHDACHEDQTYVESVAATGISVHDSNVVAMKETVIPSRLPDMVQGQGSSCLQVPDIAEMANFKSSPNLEILQKSPNVQVLDQSSAPSTACPEILDHETKGAAKEEMVLSSSLSDEVRDHVSSCLDDLSVEMPDIGVMAKLENSTSREVLENRAYATYHDQVITVLMACPETSGDESKTIDKDKTLLPSPTSEMLHEDVSSRINGSKDSLHKRWDTSDYEDLHGHPTVAQSACNSNAPCHEQLSVASVAYPEISENKTETADIYQCVLPSPISGTLHEDVASRLDNPDFHPTVELSDNRSKATYHIQPKTAVLAFFKKLEDVENELVGVANEGTIIPSTLSAIFHDEMTPCIDTLKDAAIDEKVILDDSGFETVETTGDRETAATNRKVVASCEMVNRPNSASASLSDMSESDFPKGVDNTVDIHLDVAPSREPSQKEGTIQLGKSPSRLPLSVSQIPISSSNDSPTPAKDIAENPSIARFMSLENSDQKDEVKTSILLSPPSSCLEDAPKGNSEENSSDSFATIPSAVFSGESIHSTLVVDNLSVPNIIETSSDPMSTLQDNEVRMNPHEKEMCMEVQEMVIDDYSSFPAETWPSDRDDKAKVSSNEPTFLIPVMTNGHDCSEDHNNDSLEVEAVEIWSTTGKVSEAFVASKNAMLIEETADCFGKNASIATSFSPENSDQEGKVATLTKLNPPSSCLEETQKWNSNGSSNDSLAEATVPMETDAISDPLPSLKIKEVSDNAQEGDTSMEGQEMELRVAEMEVDDSTIFLSDEDNKVNVSEYEPTYVIHVITYIPDSSGDPHEDVCDDNIVAECVAIYKVKSDAADILSSTTGYADEGIVPAESAMSIEETAGNIAENCFNALCISQEISDRAGQVGTSKVVNPPSSCLEVSLPGRSNNDANDCLAEAHIPSSLSSEQAIHPIVALEKSFAVKITSSDPMPPLNVHEVTVNSHEDDTSMEGQEMDRLSEMLACDEDKEMTVKSDEPTYIIHVISNDYDSNEDHNEDDFASIETEWVAIDKVEAEAVEILSTTGSAASEGFVSKESRTLTEETTVVPHSWWCHFFAFCIQSTKP